ncbi:MAG TPA: hypothetical protein VHP11_08015, partial [Tepidisphaeraceae bacterium]|nr:hypothetical protein [Tepidisphaeraceae bacterium]
MARNVRGGEWFECSFGRDYLLRYRHRTEAAARCEVAFILRLLNLPSHRVFLDLACGAGRHARALARRSHT